MKDLQYRLATFVAIFLVKLDALCEGYVASSLSPLSLRQTRRQSTALSAAWKDLFGSGGRRPKKGKTATGTATYYKDIIAGDETHLVKGEFLAENNNNNHRSNSKQNYDEHDGTLLGVNKMQTEIGALIAELQNKHGSNGKEAALEAKLAQLSQELEAYKAGAVTKAQQAAEANYAEKSSTPNGQAIHGSEIPFYMSVDGSLERAVSNGLKKEEDDSRFLKPFTFSLKVEENTTPIPSPINGRRKVMRKRPRTRRGGLNRNDVVRSPEINGLDLENVVLDSSIKDEQPAEEDEEGKEEENLKGVFQEEKEVTAERNGSTQPESVEKKDNYVRQGERDLKEYVRIIDEDTITPWANDFAGRRFGSPPPPDVKSGDAYDMEKTREQRIQSSTRQDRSEPMPEQTPHIPLFEAELSRRFGEPPRQTVGENFLRQRYDEMQPRDENDDYMPEYRFGEPFQRQRFGEPPPRRHFGEPPSFLEQYKQPPSRTSSSFGTPASPLSARNELVGPSQENQQRFKEPPIHREEPRESMPQRYRSAERWLVQPPRWNHQGFGEPPMPRGNGKQYAPSRPKYAETAAPDNWFVETRYLGYPSFEEHPTSFYGERPAIPPSPTRSTSLGQSPWAYDTFERPRRSHTRFNDQHSWQAAPRPPPRQRFGEPPPRQAYGAPPPRIQKEPRLQNFETPTERLSGEAATPNRPPNAELQGRRPTDRPRRSDTTQSDATIGRTPVGPPRPAHSIARQDEKEEEPLHTEDEIPVVEETKLERAPVSIWDTSFPILVEGNSLRTFSFESAIIERVQVFLKTDGHPLRANVDLWHGPDNTPQKMSVFLEDGSIHTFSTVLETPIGHNAVAIENSADVGSPLLAAVVGSDFGNGSHGLGPLSAKLSAMRPADRIIEGGQSKCWTFDSKVESVQVLLRNYKRPLHARVELKQEPNNVKQVVEIYTEDGLERPFYLVLDTPGDGNVVRVENTAPAEFPMDAVVEPYVVSTESTTNED